MAAEIVSLPVPERLCGDCTNSTIGSRGVHCHVFSEWIWDEKEAADCESWERD